MDDLVKVAISGKGAMPPKGTCATCSADELRAAIEHMVQ
jgi:cytochrome c5